MNVRFALVGLAALCAGVLLPATPVLAQGAGDSALLDALVKKGVLSDQEAEDIQASEQKDYATSAASKITLSSSIKSITFYGDLRLRYELREGQANSGDVLGTGAILTHNDSQDRSRWRFRLRFGVKGDLYDQFFYGIRLASGDTYDRSGNVTLGNTDNGGEFGNSSNLIGIDRVYLGWRPTDYLTLIGGKFENPLYTTNLVWDDNLSPSGAAEEFDRTYDNVEVFATAGQFVYGDSADNTINESGGSNYDDIFMFAEQVGFEYKFDEKTFFKGAASIYTYSGTQNGDGGGTVGGLYSASPLVLGSTSNFAQENNSPSYFTGPFVGAASASATNVSGINDLAVIETPFEFDFTIGPGRHTTTSGGGDPKDMKDSTNLTETTTGWELPMRLFADFAYNFEADERADAARGAIDALTNPTSAGNTGVAGVGTTGSMTVSGETITNANLYNSHDYQGVLHDGKSFLDQAAYQIGVEAGQLKKKGDWDGKLYWQSTGYYAVDPNLVDADIFNAATNLQGVVIQASHNWTDGLTSTLKYAHAFPVDTNLATPNVNQDLQMSDIHQYNLFQADLMWKF